MTRDKSRKTFSGDSTPKPSPSNGVASSLKAGFAANDDFIALDDSRKSHSQKEKKRRERSESPQTNKRERRRERRRRERENGGRSRDDARSGEKRKHDLISDDEDDEYRSQRSAGRPQYPWLRDINFDNCTNVAELLHREVKAFTEWVSPSPIEDEIRALTVQMITRAITRKFPDAKVHPFGSYETKLYLPQGDIDLVIISDSMAYSNKNVVLQELARTMQNGGIANKVSIIAKARVPIIKFNTILGQLKVDISLNQGSGIAGGQIVSGFLRDMQSGLALRSIVMITKAFLGQRNMNEVYSGGLGSYSIVCLVVSFLQMHPKIRRGEIDADKNLGVLLMEFFELYGCYFNYENVGISVRDGGTYFSKRQRGWFDYYKPGALSIEDPNDVANDIASGSFGFAQVRATFAGAHSILTASAFTKASILKSRRDGSSLRWRERDDPKDLSILSSVMSIAQETINHRRVIQELYDEGTLHRKLGVARGKQPAIPDATTEPLRTTTNGTGNAIASTSSSSNAAVLSAYAMRDDGSDGAREKDMDTGYDDEEDGGRYGIGSSSKRRSDERDGEEAQDVYTVDDDSDSLALEENHYASPSDEDGRSSTRPSTEEKNDRKRSYWLSKGIS